MQKNVYENLYEKNQNLYENLYEYLYEKMFTRKFARKCLRKDIGKMFTKQSARKCLRKKCSRKTLFKFIDNINNVNLTFQLNRYIKHVAHMHSHTHAQMLWLH